MAAPAPHRVTAARWVTATGRPLTEAGSAYWENLYASGVADGKGGYNRALHKAQIARVAKESPSTRAAVASQQGNQALARNLDTVSATRQAARLGDSFSAGPVLNAIGAFAKVAAESSPVGMAVHAVEHPSLRSILAAHPVLGQAFEGGVESASAARSASRSLQHGQAPSVGAALTLAGLIPGLPRFGKAARALEELAPETRAGGTVIRGFSGGEGSGRSVYISSHPQIAEPFGKVRSLEYQAQNPLVLKSNQEYVAAENKAIRWAKENGVSVRNFGTGHVAEWARAHGHDAVVLENDASPTGRLSFADIGPSSEAIALHPGRLTETSSAVPGRLIYEARQVPSVSGGAGRATRTLKAGDLEQQIPGGSRSPVTRSAVERPLDALSQKFPNVPVAGARARVMKAAGRAEKEEQRRGRVSMDAHIRALPKRGSDEDVAHFWWAQLPVRMRNVEGLQAVRGRLATELEKVAGAPTRARSKLFRADQPQRAKDLAGAVARLDQVIEAAPKLDQRALDAVSALSHDRRGILEPLNLLDPAKAADREQLVTRWLTGAQYVKETPGRLGKPSQALIAKRARVDRLQTLYDRASERAQSAASPAVSEASPATHGSYTVQRLGTALARAKDELATVETAAAKRIRPTGVLGGTAEPGGGEIFIGHRADKPPMMQRVKSIGTGKPRVPQGVGQQNKMELLSSGRVRMSTHVAAEDWAASQTYRDALRIRDRLGKAGEPVPHVEGEIPERPIKGYMLVNPQGVPVPKGWKTDRLAQLGEGNDKDIVQAAKEVLGGFLGGDNQSWADIVQQAKAAGVADKLRIIPEKDVQRFYRQFLPVPRASLGGRIYDNLIDATATSLIFFRFGYIPKNVAQNLIMAVPHQGPRLLMNVPRMASLIPHPSQSETDRELWTLLTSEVSGGATGALAKESATSLLRKPANAVTAVADLPLRGSAILHELANEGVIPKYSTRLSDDDKAAILKVLKDPSERTRLNDAMQHARDGMGDFDRLDPIQRKYARRFLVVPGWLAAGTRYPFKFAANYPGRTAALAYAAAGEPGADKLGLPQNKPVDEYLAKGLPSFIKGFAAGGDKVERVQSLLPASLPADIAFAVAQGDPLTAFSYANPLPQTGINIAKSQIETLSGETKNVPFLDALTSNVQRLAPTVGFARDLASPKQGGLYPDTSILGRIERESGVLPVRINKDVALRMRYSERGMTQSLGVVDRKTAMLKQIVDAGEKPSKALLDVFDLQQARAERLDKISAHGLPYQQKAYRADLTLLAEKGIITTKEASAAIAGAKDASEDDLKKWRRWLTDHKFSGPETDGKNILEGVRDYLKEKQPAAVG